MHTSLLASDSPHPPALLSAPASRREAGWGGPSEQQQLVQMQAAFRASGGLVRGDDLATLVRTHHDQPISVVARWIVRRSVLCFSWCGQVLIPLFQFDRATMAPRADLAPIVNELSCAFDDWEICLWFAQPNAWLDGVAPVAQLRIDPQSVLRAAQADRYVALG